LKWPLKLLKDSEMDGYLYFNANIRPGASVPRPDGYNSVVVLNSGRTGANETFFDFQTSTGMSRAEFVEAITNGQYPGYEMRKINGVKVPVSKRDDLETNNLG
jgi:hypothetical protein